MGGKGNRAQTFQLAGRGLGEKTNFPMTRMVAEGNGRAINEEFLVMVGLCTHLGCAPKFRPEVGAADMGGDEWLGGFFCPCHGSKFDLAGRVYKGVPASANLEIPPYSYESDNVLVIGVNAEAV